MKISIVSNCQGESLRDCMQAANPSLSIDFFISSDITTGKRDLNQIISTSDLVFAHKDIVNNVAAHDQHKVHYFPVIAFDAFHPDMTYVTGEKLGVKEAVYTPMLTYNSALVLYAFLKGLTAEQAVKLFTKEIFEKIGYRNRYEESRLALYQECKTVGFPIDEYFKVWAKSECFMYSFNHPTIEVMSSIALHLMMVTGIDIIFRNPARTVQDPLKLQPIWPLYPGIVDTYGLDGDFAFKPNHPHGVLNLNQYVHYCYEIYSNFDTLSLYSINVDIRQIESKINSVDKSSRNPYFGLPSHQFWKKSVVLPAVQDVDPVTTLRFQLDPSDKVATAGSCFAQHIARTLSTNGFNYFVTESPSNSLSTQAIKDGNYGVFSARYGNIYSARQLLQLILRSTNKFFPSDSVWHRSDGRLVDPFRPQIEANGFENVESLLDARRIHFDAVNRMFAEMDIFVFTLGLTEAWRSRKDGAVFPLAPGVAGGEMDSEKYEFINFNENQVTEDLQAFLEELKLLNPKCKVIVTVSPVPLIATYEPRHALVSTTYSKAVLRVAAENIRINNKHVEYFPSYEIITGSYNKSLYYEDDLRSVTQSGVDHVMRLFMKHFSNSMDTVPVNNLQLKSNRGIFDIVCDEESIANFK